MPDPWTIQPGFGPNPPEAETSRPRGEVPGERTSIGTSKALEEGGGIRARDERMRGAMYREGSKDRTDQSRATTGAEEAGGG